MTSSTSGTPCGVEEELWLDFLEDELDPSMRGDLSLHVVDCASCQQHLREFQALRTVLDVKQELPSDDFFNHLEGKIMAKVATEGLVPRRAPVWRNAPKKTLTVFALFIMVFTGPVIFDSFKSVQQKQEDISVVQAEAADEFIVQASESDLELFGDVINTHEDSADALMKAAAHKMATLDEGEFARRLGL